MVFFDLMLGDLPISEEEVDFPWPACFVLCLEDVLKFFSPVTPVEKGQNASCLLCSELSIRKRGIRLKQSSLCPQLVAFVCHPPTYTGD